MLCSTLAFTSVLLGDAPIDQAPWTWGVGGPEASAVFSADDTKLSWIIGSEVLVADPATNTVRTVQPNGGPVLSALVLPDGTVAAITNDRTGKFIGVYDMTTRKWRWRKPCQASSLVPSRRNGAVATSEGAYQVSNGAFYAIANRYYNPITSFAYLDQGTSVVPHDMRNGTNLDPINAPAQDEFEDGEFRFGGTNETGERVLWTCVAPDLATDVDNAAVSVTDRLGKVIWGWSATGFYEPGYRRNAFAKSVGNGRFVVTGVGTYDGEYDRYTTYENARSTRTGQILWSSDLYWLRNAKYAHLTDRVVRAYPFEDIILTAGSPTEIWPKFTRRNRVATNVANTAVAVVSGRATEVRDAVSGTRLRRIIDPLIDDYDYYEDIFQMFPEEKINDSVVRATGFTPTGEIWQATYFGGDNIGKVTSNLITVFNASGSPSKRIKIGTEFTGATSEGGTLAIRTATGVQIRTANWTVVKNVAVTGVSADAPLTVSEDGQTVVLGHRLIDVTSGNLLPDVLGPAGTLVAATKGASRVALAKGSAVTMSLRTTGSTVVNMKDADGEVMALALSNGGRYVAILDVNRRLSVCRAANGNVLRNYSVDVPFAGGPDSLRFSYDGSRLLLRGSDGTVRSLPMSQVDPSYTP